MSEIATLKTADAPDKAEMLAMLDKARQEVEDGITVALVLLPVHVGDQWSTRVSGDIKMLKLSGILGRAWLAANERIGSLR